MYELQKLYNYIIHQLTVILEDKYDNQIKI